MDLEENPDKVNFPNPKTCREIDKLKREIDLQEKCKECHSKNPGGDLVKIPALEKGVESLKRRLNATMDRLDQVLSHQKKDHAKIQEIQQALDCTRDELAAWAVHLQQQQQLTPRGTGETHDGVEEPYQAPTTVLTVMANKGDVKIDVTDPGSYPVGKFIVIQESLIYQAQGKGSLILERPLCRDFLAGTPVRPLNDTDQYRTEDNGEIYLQNPYQSHSPNEEQGNSVGSPQPHSYNEGQGNLGNSHGQNGDVGSPGHIELDGLGGTPIMRMGQPWKSITMTAFLVENRNLLSRGREFQLGFDPYHWLLRSQFQQSRNTGVNVMNTVLFISAHLPNWTMTIASSPLTLTRPWRR